MSNMYPTAISEVMEAIFKLLVGLSRLVSVLHGRVLQLRNRMGQQVTSEAFAKSALPLYAAAVFAYHRLLKLLSLDHQNKGTALHE
ncbi:MAG: hypothetical protein ACLSCV_04610 [Acutalibacteraceae bacterium]